jgi:hypothetical protein
MCKPARVEEMVELIRVACSANIMVWFVLLFFVWKKGRGKGADGRGESKSITLTFGSTISLRALLLIFELG